MWLNKNCQLLVASGIPTARLDCLVLLEDVTGKDRGWLLAHPEFELSATQLSSLSIYIKRRSTHEPLAYIRGKTEFYGREFLVTTDTLEPRPETENMIDLFLSQPESKYEHIVADIGTGSGAIAITIALECPLLSVVATDVSHAAINIAEQNSKKHKASIKLLCGDLLEPLSEMPDVILANLPYVPDAHTINNAAMHEPKLAIFGGADGLDMYKRMFRQISDISAKKPKLILTESLPTQHSQLALTASKHGYALKKSDDFVQLFRLTG